MLWNLGTWLQRIKAGLRVLGRQGVSADNETKKAAYSIALAADMTAFAATHKSHINPKCIPK